MAPSKVIDVAPEGVIARVLAVPATMQELFTVTVIFPATALHAKEYQTEFVPAPDVIVVPVGALQL